MDSTFEAATISPAAGARTWIPKHGGAALALCGSFGDWETRHREFNHI